MVQVTIGRKSWKLSDDQLAFIEKLKTLEKEEIKLIPASKLFTNLL